MKKNIAVLMATLGLSVGLAQEKKVTVEDIYTGQFSQRYLQEINSMENGTSYSRLESNGVELYDYTSQNKIETIVNGEFEGYSFSKDENLVLLESNVKPLFRHSKLASYKVYNRTTKKTVSVFGAKQIQEPSLSPDNKKVAFAFENNIYIQDLTTLETTQVTKDGLKNKIINGTTDWVYEEEFAFVRAFHWNKTSDHIAYLRFDETEVPEFSMNVFGAYGKALYPSNQTFKYPKAGEKNSKVSLKIYNVKTAKTSDINVGDYQYIPRLRWTNKANTLSFMTMNRHQSELNFNFLDVNTNKFKTVLKETDKAYVDVELNNNLTFLEDNSFIWASEKSGFNHLYHYSNSGKLKKQLTKGKWEVTSFYGLNENTKTLYYQSTENGSINRGVYSVSLKGSKKKSLATKAGFNSASFSSNFKYFISTYSNAQTANLYTLNDGKSGKVLKTIEDNKRVMNRVSNFEVSYKEFSELKTENGQTLNSWTIKPKNFDASKKYPLLMFQYSGPGSQQVQNKWMSANDFWYQSLASQGYIIVCVDARGTGFKGRDFKKMTYKELGKYEVADQTSAAITLGKLPYIDADRIGIWGWSYGGFMASNCLFQSPEVFKMGIAVAPVTSWRFYDSIYTERYMQTPQENASGYDDNSPITHVDNLKGNYLLVHGTADDNVHYQNATVLTEALVQANKQFDQFIYTDKNHGIYGGNTRIHLFNMLTRYVKNNL